MNLIGKKITLMRNLSNLIQTSSRFLLGLKKSEVGTGKKLTTFTSAEKMAE